MWEHAILGISLTGHVVALMPAFMDAPRETDPAWYRVFYAFANAVACNFGKARNVDRPT